MLGLRVVGWLLLAADPAGVCDVEVTGMPVAALSHHEFTVGTGAPRVLTSRARVAIGDERTLIRVTGPRYTGARWLTPEDCASADVVTLAVTPRPAELHVPCLPGDLTLECVRCPGVREGDIFLAKRFPTIAMRTHSQAIEVILRAPGYRVERRRILLLPGRNELKVKLTPL